jgi:hypothetical protein
MLMALIKVGTYLELSKVLCVTGKIFSTRFLGLPNVSSSLHCSCPISISHITLTMNASVKEECKHIGSTIIFINELEMKNRYGKRIEMEKN